MKKITLMMVGLNMLLSPLGNTAIAGDTFSYAVSCTIPAIPGVNVSLVEENSFIALRQQDQNIVEENSREIPGGILVKTLYEK